MVRAALGAPGGDAVIALLLTWGLAGLAMAQDDAPAEAAPAPDVPTVEEALAPLEAAYQKEFAYLAAEKEGLEQRIAAHATEAARARAAAEAELDRLEARLTALRVQVELREAQLADVDRAATAALEASDALEAAWFQATSTLDAEIAEPEEEAKLEGYAAGFREIYAIADQTLADGAQVRAGEGSWFARDGAEVSGELVRVGNVATFGVRDGEGAALVPAGEHRLQAWREGGGATGVALVEGRTPETMGLYLHEGRTKRIDERPPKTLSDVLEAGGVVGYVIVVLGLLAALLMVLRAIVLARAGRGSDALEQALELVEHGKVAEARTRAERAGGTAARVVARMLDRVHDGRAIVEDVANETLLQETPRVERFGAAILVIAAVAPLLGLLGTVTGMIATFEIITEYGTGDPRMLSGGISAALVTTQFGLIVAIPALLGGNLLSGWGERVLGRAENAALRVLNALDAESDHPTPLAQASK